MSYPMFQREEFKQWLISFNNLPVKSADSYVSYVAGANNQFIIEGDSMCDLVEKFYKDDKPLMIDATISNVHNQLYRSDICKITGKAKGTIENWRTGLLTYKEFFSTITNEVEEEETINDFLEAQLNLDIANTDAPSEIVELIKTKPIKSKTFVFNKSALKKIFKNRFLTQDRFYGSTFFPISYLNRLFNSNGQKEYFKNWVDDQLNAIEILCENGKHRLMEIAELKITVSKETSEVTILVDKQVKAMYTLNATGTQQLPISIISIELIAIDHIHPMKKILMDNIKSLPQLGIITGQLKGIARKATAKEYKAAGTVLLNQPPLDQINFDLLKIELDLIKSHTKLQLMDKMENLKKRAN